MSKRKDGKRVVRFKPGTWKCVYNTSLDISGCVGYVMECYDDRLCIKLLWPFEELDEWDNVAIWDSMADEIPDGMTGAQFLETISDEVGAVDPQGPLERLGTARVDLDDLGSRMLGQEDRAVQHALAGHIARLELGGSGPQEIRKPQKERHDDIRRHMECDTAGDWHPWPIAGDTSRRGVHMMCMGCVGGCAVCAPNMVSSCKDCGGMHGPQWACMGGPKQPASALDGIPLNCIPASHLEDACELREALQDMQHQPHNIALSSRQLSAAVVAIVRERIKEMEQIVKEAE